VFKAVIVIYIQVMLGCYRDRYRQSRRRYITSAVCEFVISIDIIIAYEYIR
jgi:hypothetical protein